MARKKKDPFASIGRSASSGVKHSTGRSVVRSLPTPPTPQRSGGSVVKGVKSVASASRPKKLKRVRRQARVGRQADAALSRIIAKNERRAVRPAASLTAKVARQGTRVPQTFKTHSGVSQALTGAYQKVAPVVLGPSSVKFGKKNVPVNAGVVEVGAPSAEGLLPRAAIVKAASSSERPISIEEAAATANKKIGARVKDAPKKIKVRVKNAKVHGKNTATYVRHPGTAARAIHAGVPVLTVKHAAVLGSVPAVTAGVEGAKREALGFYHNPMRTAETTGRTAVGIPYALAGIGADTISAIHHGTLDPLRGDIEQQKKYLQTYSRLISTPSEKKAEHIVQNKLGLVPVATAGLSALAIAKQVKRLPAFAKDAEHATVDRTTRKLKARAEDPNASSRERAAARKELESPRQESHREAKARSRRAAQRSATQEQAVREASRREYQKAGKRNVEQLGKREDFPRLMSRLDRKNVTGQISKGDTVRVLYQTGWRSGTHDVLGKVKRILTDLEDPSRPIHPDDPHTRAVLQTLLDHPSLLDDRGILSALSHLEKMQPARLIERGANYHGGPVKEPRIQDLEASQRSQMRNENVRTGGERIPSELRGKVKIKEKAGRGAERHVRETAKRMQRSARKQRVQAEALRKAGRHKKAAKLEERADVKDATAEERLAVVDRFKRADDLEIQAAQIDAGQAQGSASAFRAEATALRHAGEASQRVRMEEALKQIADVRKRENLAEGGYLPQSDIAREGGPNTSTRFRGKNPAKDKYNKGVLERQGRVDESGATLVRGLDRQRRTLEADRHAATLIGEEAYHDAKGNPFFTEGERRRLQSEGKLGRGMESYPVQQFRGSVQRNADLAAKFHDAQIRAKATMNSGERDLSLILPHSTIREMNAQLEPGGRLAKASHTAMRVQVAGMLYDNPTWAFYQIPATPGAIIAAHWNPATYLKAIVKGIPAYHRLPTYKKVALRATVQATSGDLMRDWAGAHTGITSNTIREAVDARRSISKTPFGRMFDSLRESVKAGGPIGGFIHRYESSIRLFEQLMQAEKLTGLTEKGTPTLTSRVVRFVESQAGLTNTIYKHQDAMLGMNRTERLSFYADSPTHLRELSDETLRMLGDFGSMTHAERNWTGLVPFYTFVRYSLHWLFKAMPQDHPVKLAILVNLAQSNDIELTKVLHGYPDFLQTFGTVVTHTGENGRPVMGINLARSAPGSNAILEALSGGKIDLSTALRPIQPILGTAILSLAGQDAFGNPARGTTLEQFAKGVTSLSPLTRQAGKAIGPGQSDLSKLFQAVQGTPSGLSGTLIPRPFVDLNKAGRAQALSEIVARAYPDNLLTPQTIKYLPQPQRRDAQGVLNRSRRAKAQLDALYLHYGIRTAASNRKFKKQGTRRSDAYYKRHDIFGYPSNQSSGGGDGGGWGSSGGGGGGGW